MEDIKKSLKTAAIGSGCVIILIFAFMGGWINSNNSSAQQPLNVSEDYIVKTDEEGALPALSEEQLKKACDCLSSSQKTNALNFIKALKEAENTYKVNAVFSLAVFKKENGIATNKSGILGKGTYNIGSVSGRYNGNYITVTHKDGSTQDFKVYPNYDEAIIDYADNIANGSYYFTKGLYSVDEIAPVYCDEEWGVIVKQYIDEFYEAAGVDITSNSSNIDSSIDNADVKTIMQWTDKQAWKAITGTAYSKKPTSSQVSKSTMDKRMTTITVKIRTGKDTSKNQNITINKAIAPLWEAFFKDLYEQCQEFYIVSYDGAYVYRNSTSGSSMSAHAFGCAIDLNANVSGNRYKEKPYSKSAWEKLSNKRTKHSTIYFNSPMLEIAHKYTLVNGADWSNPNDAMHTSFIGDWDRAKAKEKFGK